MSNPSLHLASSSPRRSEILSSLGLTFTASGVDVDETPIPGEPAEAMVLRLALAKARAASCDAGTVVIGADTSVVLDSVIFGKPGDEEDALAMLAQLSGRTHRVLTGVAVVAGERAATAVSGSDVRFREIGPDEARAYWQSGEPQDKAGSYAIQGLGGIFVESIAGSYSGIVGLPVFETTRLLQDAGFEVMTREAAKR